MFLKRQTLRLQLSMLIALLTLVFSAFQSTTAIAQRLEDQPDGPALSPTEAAQSFTIAQQLQWTQLLSEPTLRQPLFSTFDPRGRLWVVQYLQYPEPAGIKALSRDNFWRIVYDRLPKPPGQDVPGADRLTIFDDPDGDGQYTEVGDFVNGLNIATSIYPTVDGAWVLNPPHLLYYRDADGDLKADGPPEVHLEGFGLEDTHSVVNSLCMGPDGWLYAAQGSTVTAAVKRYGSAEKPQKSLGQLIWRYHPQRRIYEIFAEGGGNAFGVAFDDQGRVYSGHNGGDTRGFHYVQGGYFRKGFNKHGDLSNPYSLGYLLPMPHDPVQRFSHTMLLTNGTVMQSAMPDAMLCVDPLHGTLVHSRLLPMGSSFKTEDVELAVKSTDKWFRPVAIADGPDGAAYVSDWYDFQVAHLYAHVGKLDKDHGRLYRLAPPGSDGPHAAWDAGLATATDAASASALVAKLKHPFRWQRNQARQLLARHPLRTSVYSTLEEMLGSDQYALESLWALHACGWLADAITTNSSAAKLIEPASLMSHASSHVRQWAVRLAADDLDVSATTLNGILELAKREQDPSVLVQIAASAKRLPTDKCLQICSQLVDRDLPVDDPYLPLMIWWAVEKQCDQFAQIETALVLRTSLYRHAVFQQHIAPRIVERCGMIGGDRYMQMIATILNTVEKLPADIRSDAAKACVAGFERAMAGRTLAGVPNSVLDGLTRLGQPSLALQLRRGDTAAQEQAANLLLDVKADVNTRMQVARIFGEVPGPVGLPALLQVCTSDKAPLALRMAAASSLAAYKDPQIAETMIANWNKWPGDLRSSAGAMLVAKTEGAVKWLDALDAKTVQPGDLPLEVVRQLRLHTEPALLKRIDSYYPPIGKVDLVTAQKKASEVSQIILGGNGDPYRGKKLYKESCGRCHVLFDSGGQVGPNLTGYQRDQLNLLLINVIAPNLEIREGYQAMVALTSDSQLLTGFIERENPEQVVLRAIDGQSHILDRGDIESLRPQPVSLMPEGLLDQLTPEQLCDLFAYLRSSQPLSDGT